LLAITTRTLKNGRPEHIFESEHLNSTFKFYL
jgi:hypothetical protein